MQIIESIKRLIAIVILICFFLPLCQCSPKAAPEQGLNSQVAAKVEIFIPYEKFSLKGIEESVLFFVFVWPLIFIAIRKASATRIKTILVNAMEVTLGVASFGYLFQIIRLWGEIKYGGVISLTAFFCLVTVSLLVLLKYAKRKIV